MTAAGYGAVVLAAGRSARLGRPKQLLELDGEPLVRRAARVAAEAGFDPVVVVLGAEADAVGAALGGARVTVVRNPHWRTGVASSIRAGVRTARATRGDLAGVLLASCDQPSVEAVHLRRLAEALRGGGAIAASSYAGTVGIPALFSRAVLDELLALEGDGGAKAIVLRDPARVAAVPLPGGERDIDTEADWSGVRRGE